MTGRVHRRRFLTRDFPAAAALVLPTVVSARAWAGGANEKLNLAAVGVGGRGAGNIGALARSENVVALCDVDARRLAEAAERYPGARRYDDFRPMLDRENVDAVVVSTPDHTHAAVSVAAMSLGRHVYCEKPLASSIHEARQMAETATRSGVVTQMGNQLHASEPVRRVVELLHAEVLGPVRKVVTFCNKVLRHSGGDLPGDRPPVPPHLDWDLWLGPAAERPYHPVYHPGGWRVFWGLGSGNFGDMACHILDAPYWGLGLRYPVSVEAEGPPPHPHVAPTRMVVRYRFVREGGAPPLEAVWYDGELAPPEASIEGLELPGEGALVIGDRGQLLHSFRSGEIRLLPDEEFSEFEPPEPTLPRPRSHYEEWIEACKGRGQTSSDFRYGAALTETVLAGVVAFRLGERLEWDGPGMRAANAPQAEPLVRPPLREGWSLET